MTAPPCATGCKRPSPSAIICADCTGALRAALTMAAAIEADLLDAVARQLRHGHGGRSASAEPPLPYDPAASDARRELSFALANAVYAINGHEHWPVDDTSIGGLARWLLTHMAELASYPFAARDHAAITAAVERCARVLDGPPATVYAGPCPGCGADLLAAPGAAIVKCRAVIQVTVDGRPVLCGRSADVRLQQDAMRAVLEDRLFTAAELVSMAAALGCPVSEHTVRSWVHRRQLAPKGTRPRDHGEPSATYRFGDLLDLAARRQRVKG
jgi:hypothetical protein